MRTVNSEGRAAYMAATRGDPNARREDGWLPQRAALLRRLDGIRERLDRHDKRLDRIEADLDALWETTPEADSGP